jgi:hypothetical protein
MGENQNKKYEEFYNNYLEEQRNTHVKNQRKIRVGLKVNIFLPLVFLLISFLTNGSKLIFLILWIVSLFGIAFYLMYVEYTDYKLQEQLKEFVDNDTLEPDNLIGERVDRAEAIINTKMDALDEMIEGKKEENRQKLEAGKQKVKEKIVQIKGDNEDA